MPLRYNSFELWGWGRGVASTAQFSGTRRKISPPVSPSKKCTTTISSKVLVSSKNNINFFTSSSSSGDLLLFWLWSRSRSVEIFQGFLKSSRHSALLLVFCSGFHFTHCRQCPSGWRPVSTRPLPARLSLGSRQLGPLRQAGCCWRPRCRRRRPASRSSRSPLPPRPPGNQTEVINAKLFQWRNE